MRNFVVQSRYNQWTHLDETWSRHSSSPVCWNSSYSPYNTKDGCTSVLTTYLTSNSYNGTYLIFSPDAFPDLLGHPVVKEIAELYGKTPAQVMLHFLVQEKIVVIPKSTSESRLKVYTYDDLFYNRAKDLPISVRCSFIGYLF